ncbi:MAG: response regulator [Caldilineaceae bacterium]|nr:response regulator [Caldilineaceae bacterium]
MVRILVVDDNTSMREAVCEMLQEAGYETISVENGRFAAQIHRNDPINIMVTDLFMPETDGLELIHQFRHEFPDVKIIAVSGGGSRGLVELLTVAQKLGAQRTLMKPFSGEDLLTAVQELLPNPSSN